MCAPQEPHAAVCVRARVCVRAPRVRGAVRRFGDQPVVATATVGAARKRPHPHAHTRARRPREVWHTACSWGAGDATTRRTHCHAPPRHAPRFPGRVHTATASRRSHTWPRISRAHTHTHTHTAVETGNRTGDHHRGGGSWRTVDCAGIQHHHNFMRKTFFPCPDQGEEVLPPV